MAEYLQRIVRLVILRFLVLGASPNGPTVDSFVGGLAQGLAGGFQMKFAQATFYMVAELPACSS